MTALIRRISFVVGLLLVSYIGWRAYLYFFDHSSPSIELKGLSDGCYYSKDIAFAIVGEDRYKVSTFTVWLDDSVLIPEKKVNKSFFEHPLIISTKDLNHGVHTLRIEMIDGAYHKNKNVKAVCFNVDNEPLQGAFLRPEIDFKVMQGRTFHLPIQCNKKLKRAVVKVFSKEYSVVSESENATVYEGFIPVECEEKVEEHPFIVEAEDFIGNTLILNGKLGVVFSPFKKQVIRLVDPQKFEEDHRIGKSEKEFSDLLQNITSHSSPQKLWRGQFYVPLNMTAVMCDFGTRRVSQERGCYIHAALDLIGLPKTVIWAPQDGLVAAKDRFAVTGNTVVVDHGCGILSILCHLDKFADIQVGDKIRRGNPIGIMGKTGYATGDHLHWEMRVQNVCVDPLQWTKRDF